MLLDLHWFDLRYFEFRMVRQQSTFRNHPCVSRPMYCNIVGFFLSCTYIYRIKLFSFIQISITGIQLQDYFCSYLSSNNNYLFTYLFIAFNFRYFKNFNGSLEHNTFVYRGDFCYQFDYSPFFCFVLFVLILNYTRNFLKAQRKLSLRR